MKPAIIVHGGCGDVAREEELPRTEACERAVEIGWEVLQRGGSALDAVEAAVRRLEDEPILNAGTGAYLQADGVARLDASVMTSDARAGAVAQVPNLKNPVRLARYLLEQEAHVMLCGLEALHLALRLGHEQLIVATPQKVDYWRDHLKDAHHRLDYAAMAEEWKSENVRLGTVGCVAVDAHGRLAAATSTGGIGQCYPGRVGDSPIIGAGTYATPHAACSMTGLGERIMVRLSALRLCEMVGSGRELNDAAQSVIADLESIGGAAGLIAINADGQIVERRNTRFMATARRSDVAL